MVQMNPYIGNRVGLPVISVTPVVSATDVRFVLPNEFRWCGAKGKVVLQLTAPIPTDTTDTLAILVEHRGETRPLNNVTGAGLTVSDIGAAIVLDVFFDKSQNALAVTSSLI